MPGRYALIVANHTYDDAKLSRLRAPTHDAEALARVLSDPQIGDFEVELSVDEPEYTLRRRIATFFSERARDDLLLLHFSCHGLKDDSGQLYFAAADTDVAQLDATAISAEFVSRQMTRSRSRKVVALLDCCYSGAIARGMRFRAGETVQLDDHLGGHGRVVLTASSAMEYAFEGDELTGEGKPSVFTSAVVKGLETGEADRDQDSRISVDELYDYVCEQVREVTPDQSPNMLSHLEGELYVARSSYVAPVEPAQLPIELRSAIDSPFAAVREGAVAALAGLAAGSDAGLALTAEAALRSLAEDDSRRVGASAAQALAAAAAAATRAVEPLAPPPPLPAPAAPPATTTTGTTKPTPATARRAAGDAGEAAKPAAASERQRLRLPAPAVRPPPAELVLAGAGALLVLLAMIPWQWPFEVPSAAASVAAVLALALVAMRRRAVGSSRDDRAVRLGASAAALAVVPLGVALGAHQVDKGVGYGFTVTFSPTVAALGSLLLAAAALLHAASWTPRPRSVAPVDGLVVIAGVAVAFAVLGPWGNGNDAVGAVLATIVLVAATAIAASLAGLLGPRGLTISAVAGVAVPAAGVLVAMGALTVGLWFSSKLGGTSDSGLENTLVAALALTVAGFASLESRLRIRRRQGESTDRTGASQRSL